jgi:hypothetical protein
VTKDMKKQFLAERARALATVCLTRRADLVLTATKQDGGLEYHVAIEREGKPMRPMFGVLLRAVFEPVTADQANKIVSPTVSQFQKSGGFTYPVALLFFTMREDQAFFAWLAEPVIDCAGSPKLLLHKQTDCRALTDVLLDEAVTRVVEWYDALQAALVTDKVVEASAK